MKTRVHRLPTLSQQVKALVGEECCGHEKQLKHAQTQLHRAHNHIVDLESKLASMREEIRRLTFLAFPLETQFEKREDMKVTLPTLPSAGVMPSHISFHLEPSFSKVEAEKLFSTVAHPSQSWLIRDLLFVHDRLEDRDFIQLGLKIMHDAWSKTHRQPSSQQDIMSSLRPQQKVNVTVRCYPHCKARTSIEFTCSKDEEVAYAMKHWCRRQRMRESSKPRHLSPCFVF